jgi:hypothetical protein
MAPVLVQRIHLWRVTPTPPFSSSHSRGEDEGRRAQREKVFDNPYRSWAGGWAKPGGPGP